MRRLSLKSTLFGVDPNINKKRAFHKRAPSPRGLAKSVLGKKNPPKCGGKKAWIGIEPMMKLLQSLALPLGYHAEI